MAICLVYLLEAKSRYSAMDKWNRISQDSFKLGLALGGTAVGCIGIYHAITTWKKQKLKQYYSNLGKTYKNQCYKRLQELEDKIAKVTS